MGSPIIKRPIHSFGANSPDTAVNPSAEEVRGRVIRRVLDLLRARRFRDAYMQLDDYFKSKPNQVVPLAPLLEALSATLSGGSHPISQTAFAWVNTSMGLGHYLREYGR